MLYYFLGMTVVFILGTIAVWHIRRRLGNTGIETPIIGAALWILMTIFFLGQITSGRQQEPEYQPEISTRKSPATRSKNDSRSVFTPPKLKKRPARFIEDDYDENDFGNLDLDTPLEPEPQREPSGTADADKDPPKPAEQVKPYIPRSLVPGKPKRRKRR